MKYVDKVLEPGEQVLARGTLHWIIYVLPVIATTVGVLMLSSHDTAPIGGLLLFIAIPLWLHSWIERATTEIAVTSKRVIFKRGLIWRSTIEMNANKVESVNVAQSILGRLLDFGTITVRGTGTGIEPIRNIADPLLLRRAVNQ